MSKVRPDLIFRSNLPAPVIVPASRANNGRRNVLRKRILLLFLKPPTPALTATVALTTGYVNTTVVENQGSVCSHDSGSDSKFRKTSPAGTIAPHQPSAEHRWTNLKRAIEYRVYIAS
ncbi:uncharacterized protein LOC111255090 [Varroa destructor]|uniref:Uncharacterized protein n=1 Tax=Varroa destructor TaxID=109461 RepID=A0A7M7KXZ8_VARDE|nr:uncharacterized protein LOC111255090 [Varroa destructor]